MNATLLHGLFWSFAFYALFLLGCWVVVSFLPASFLGPPAKTLLTWLPPFVHGEALRNWATTIAEQLAKKRLAGKRSGKTAGRLASEVEEAAMHAMLPMAGAAELERVVACPATGQGTVGVTAPEAIAIAAYIRKNLSPAEQQRIHRMATENAKKIASTTHGDPQHVPLLIAREMNAIKIASEAHRESSPEPLPCPLQGGDHVCCVYAARPLRCRILHAISISKEMTAGTECRAASQAKGPDENRYEQTVAEGIELGVTRALKSAGLSADVYELNIALATALETPDAAERWANGENVFRN